MKIRVMQDGEVLTDALVQMIEEETQKEIFTMRVLEHKPDGLESLIIFKDTSVLMGLIKVTDIQGKLALRLQGNYI